MRKSLAENKLEAYEKAKKSLPAFTPSGKFVGGRKMEFLEAYSNFIILDIDKLSQTDLQNAKHKANQSESAAIIIFKITPKRKLAEITVKLRNPQLRLFLGVCTAVVKPIGTTRHTRGF